MSAITLSHLTVGSIPGLVKAGPRLYQDGIQLVFRFPNGFGASVIEGEGSYGVELAVLCWATPTTEDDEFFLTYDTGVTDDVVGHLDAEGLADLLNQIQALPVHYEAVES
jgi:hypothetical protein